MAAQPYPLRGRFGMRGSGASDGSRSMRSNTTPPVPAVEQTLALFEPARRPAAPRVEDGYLDLLGEEDPTGAHPGQRLMLSGALALIYERLWRPLGGRLLMGATGPRIGDEHRIALS